MTRVFIALGSNIDSERTMRKAVRRLSSRCRLLAVSPVYETLPVGRADQPKFLNAAALIETDQGNLILDCRFGPIADVVQLAAQLSERAGIAEHGLFVGLATDVIVAGQDGVRHLTRGM